MDWIEGQLDDESIFPQKLGMLLILVDLWCTLSFLGTHDVGAIKNGILVSDLEFGFPLSRHTVPAKLQGSSEDNIQAPVSCLCPHISLSLSEDCQPQGGGSS